jgi:tetratricopeptide (TPR) repeat protein
MHCAAHPEKTSMKKQRRALGQDRAKIKPNPVLSTSTPLKKTQISNQTIWICIGLVAINLFAFASVRNNDFINYDDPQYVSENPHIAQGLTWQAVSWAFTSGYAFNWHPLTWISHLLDIQFHGLNAGLHHVTSLMLHTATTVLLFCFLLWTTGAAGPSAFVAALFAVHPLHVESVVWAAERKDVLSALFLMLTLCAYVAYVRRPATRRYVLVFLLFAAGLMAKPMLVTVPFALMLLDVWPLGRKSPLTEKLPLSALAAASSVVTFLVQRQGGAVAALEALPLKFRVQNAIVSYAAYVGDMLWPTGLAPFYPYKPLPGWLVALSALGIMAVSAGALAIARRRPYIAVGWLWYLGTLFPVIGIVQVGDQARADRYTYIPLIGLFVMAAWGLPELLARWKYRNRVLAAAAGLAVAVCAIGTQQQVRRWKNSVTIWEHALQATTDNDLAHANLAIALWEQGKVSESITHYKESLRIKPGVASVHGDLGVALENQGDVDGAIRELQEAAKLKPLEATYQYNLGVLAQRKGDTADARRYFEATLSINPQHQEARQMLDSLRGSPHE